jgi:PAS domain S-box-containing protein
MHAAFSAAADAIVAVGPDLTVLLWNPAAEQLFGWPAADVVSRPLPIVPEECLAEHRAVLERVRTGGHVSISTRRLRRDGSRVDVRATINAMRADDGRLLGWMAVFREVEEEVAAQNHMAERIRLVRRLNDVIADLGKELALPAVLDRITASLIELTGADAAGFSVIEGDSLRLVSISGLPESLRGSSNDLHTSLMSELLRSGKTAMLATSETRPLHDLIWSELQGLHTVAIGVSNVQGRPYGALYALFSKARVGHIELELLELFAGHAGVVLGNAELYTEALRQRAHERSIIDASGDGIAVLDDAGLVRQWNPAARALTGVPADEAIGKPPPFPLPGPGDVGTHQLECGTWLNILCSEIEETGERVVDFRDVTEAKALEEAKDLFLATTSHELRTPITVVQGFASTLASRWDNLADADRRNAADTIADRSQSLGRLVEHLLLGSRAGAGDLSVTIEPFDLGGLLGGATAAFQTLSDGHVLELDLPDDLPSALGDVMATDIIIGQLLENAFKYSPDGGTVAVRVRRRRTGSDRDPDRDAEAVASRGGHLHNGDGGDLRDLRELRDVRDGWSARDGQDGRQGRTELVIDVEDDGVGISADDCERVFERFVQGEAGDRRRFGGIGLGLYIVRRLALAQRGDVSAHPRPEGGTRMRVILPAAD